MAATNLTMAKLKHARTLVFWIAQNQESCSYCGDKLLLTSRLSDIDDLTVEHTSGSYDHKNMRETSNNKFPVILMHKTCHKSMTLKNAWKDENSKMNLSRKTGVRNVS